MSQEAKYGARSQESAEAQKRDQQRADRRVSDLCHAFNEIMRGPNPLSPDEIRKLVALRPQYRLFEAWCKEGT